MVIYYERIIQNVAFPIFEEENIAFRE